MASNDPIDVFKSYAIGNDEECWPWLGSWGGRSGDLRPYFQANSKRMMAYRWVYELVNGVELRQDQRLLHSCDQGNYPVGCGNPAHLRIGSAQDNMNDMMERQRHGMPKTVVRAIRTLLEEGRTQQDIAKLYGIAESTVSAIAVQRSHKTVV